LPCQLAHFGSFCHYHLGAVLSHSFIAAHFVWRSGNVNQISRYLA